MLLGIYMAATKDHGQFVTHAHIMLMGFLLSFVYAVCHKLWLHEPSATLATIQFYLHHLGSLVLLVGLYAMFAGAVDNDSIGPVLGLSSITVLIALLLMGYLLLKSRGAD